MNCCFLNEMSRGRLILLLIASLTMVACGKADISDAEYVNRAKQQQATGQLKASLIELKNALQQNPNNSEARLLLGELYILVGDGAASEKEIKKAMSLGISGEYVDKLLGRSLLLQHRYIDVLKMLENNDVLSQPELLVLRGEAQLGLRNVTQAVAAFKQAISIEPDTKRAQLGLARIELDNNNHDSAAERVEIVIAKNRNDAEAWLIKGEVANRQGNVEEALAGYRQSINLSPKMMPTFISMEAHSGLARLLIRQNKFDEAEQHIKHLLKVASKFSIPNYLAALLAYEKKQYDEAKNYLQVALKIAPENLASILLLGSTNYILGNLEQAQSQLSTVVAEKPNFLAARMLLAEVRLRQHQSDHALDTLEPALLQAPSDARLLAMVGQAALRSGELERGRKILQSAVSKQPNSSGLRAQLAMLYLAEGNDTLAARELEQAIKSGAGAQKEQALLALTYMRQKKFNLALEIAQRLVKENPEKAYPENFLGLIFLEMGNIRKAREAFDKSLQINPDFFTATLNLARLNILEGRMDAARTRVESILARDDQNVPAILILAQLASGDKDDQQAIKWLERARKADANALVPRLVLAKYYVRTGDIHLALEVVREAKGFSLGNAHALDVIARVELSAKKYAVAAQTFEKIIKLKPQADAYFWQAIAHIQGGNTSSARVAFRAALQLKPDHLRAATLLAVMDMDGGDSEKALQQASKIKRQHPMSPNGFELEGDIQVRIKHDAKAIQAYEAAAKRGGGSRITLKQASALRRTQGNKPAIGFVSKWLEKYPGDIKARYMQAAMYESEGKRENAIGEFKKILEHDPSNITALNDIAWLLHQKNHTDEALIYADRAYKLDPQSGVVLDTYGWIMLADGQTKAALGFLRQAYDKQPTVKEVQYHYAAALVKSGKRDEEAKRILQNIFLSGQDFSGKKKAQELLDSLKAN